MILAGDIGGTKSNIALFTVRGDHLSPRVERTLASKDYPGLEELIRAFLDEATGHPSPGSEGHITAACFGVAGPVVEGRCEATNLPWVIDERDLGRILEVKQVSVINDLVATAYGVPVLGPNEVCVLNEGQSHSQGNMALIAAGTGLGEAILFWDGEAYRAVSSEGGHADLAPRNALEIRLLQYLLSRFHRVSYERVLSGPGIFNIYSFLKEAGYAQEPPWLVEEFQGQDPSTVITEAAMQGKSDLCVRALHLFVSLYGAEAGNLALKALATGGVYVGGGIAPKILDQLKDGTFMAAFTDKGRLSPLLEAMPVRVILDPKTALYGAARCASLLRA
ncbi:MAG: glucokinase [Candidatus Methylomirabilales bacterium]